jgi:uncharacterized repeat protein (TIGR03833 family)
MKWDMYKEFTIMNGNERKNIRSGIRVAIVLKQDQDTGKLTDGVVRDILTKSATHPHGIKVRLMSGEVGRVKEIHG